MMVTARKLIKGTRETERKRESTGTMRNRDSAIQKKGYSPGCEDNKECVCVCSVPYPIRYRFAPLSR